MAHSMVIADDHDIVRQGIRQVLAADPRLEIVGEAANGLEAIRLVKTLNPFILILDLAMPYAKGVEVFTEVRRWRPDTKIIVYTGLAVEGLLAQIAAANIDGLLLKSGNSQELLMAIDKIIAGERYIAPEIMRLSKPGEDRPILTKRELQILSMVASGYRNMQIATHLNISQKTVDNHRTNLMRKLEVHSVAELMAYAVREGLLDPAQQS